MHKATQNFIAHVRSADKSEQSVATHLTETAVIAGLLASQAGLGFARAARHDGGFVWCINQLT